MGSPWGCVALWGRRCDAAFLPISASREWRRLASPSSLVQLVAFGGLVLGGSLWNLVWICQQPRGAGGCDLGDEERERANAVERIQLLELQRGGCLRERRRLVEWAICLGLCR